MAKAIADDFEYGVSARSERDRKPGTVASMTRRANGGWNNPAAEDRDLAPAFPARLLVDPTGP